MKVGLISIHSAHNYGSVLQAYALQEVLKQYSTKFELINYRPKYLDCQYSMFSIKVYDRFPGALNKFIHFGWRLVMLPKRYIKYNKFENFINSNMDLTIPYTSFDVLKKQNFDYDVVFVGSDQVWNTDITEGFDRTFYLDFLTDSVKRISYAASIGRKTLDEKYIDDYVECLNKFDNIALREESSVSLLTSILNKNIEVTLDPTLLLEKKHWITLCEKSILDCEEKDYIFVYILQDNPEFTKVVNDISKRLNLPIYSISKKRRFKNEKIFPDAGPEDFLKLCMNSKFVVTNSFHGTVFSLIFEKDNCIIPHLSTGARMVDLMTNVGLKDRILTSFDQLDKLDIYQNINYQKVKDKLDGYRESSLNYIRRVME